MPIDLVPLDMEDKLGFSFSETMFTDIGNVNIGQKLRIIINYTVIEETKNYRVLRVGHLQPLNTKRIT